MRRLIGSRHSAHRAHIRGTALRGRLYAAIACTIVRSWAEPGRWPKAAAREAMPVSIEPPPPSAEQLADWQALIERIRQGDRSQLLAWDEAEAVGTAAAYQVLITQLIHQRLRDASP